MVFSNPKPDDVNLIVNLMQNFGNVTGLKMNMDKSAVATIRCADSDIDAVLAGFTGQRIGFPITYLGLPLTLGRLRLVHLQSLQDKARARLAGWQAGLMSLAGRRELVRAVLSALLTYLLTALKVPKKFIKELDKLRRKFLWAGNQELHGGKCKVSWARVLRPMDRGGLGIQDLEKFGRALRLRWLWHQWKSPDKPWNGSELPVD